MFKRRKQLEEALVAKEKRIRELEAELAAAKMEADTLREIALASCKESK